MAISGPWVIQHSNVAKEPTRAKKPHLSIDLRETGLEPVTMQSKYKSVNVILT